MVAEVGLLPMKNYMFQSQNSIETVSVLSWQYYPGHKRKKNDIQARSEMACWQSVTPCTAESRVWRMEIGSEWTLLGRVYYLL